MQSFLGDLKHYISAEGIIPVLAGIIVLLDYLIGRGDHAALIRGIEESCRVRKVQLFTAYYEFFSIARSRQVLGPSDIARNFLEEEFHTQKRINTRDFVEKVERLDDILNELHLTEKIFNVLKPLAIMVPILIFIFYWFARYFMSLAGAEYSAMWLLIGAGGTITIGLQKCVRGFDRLRRDPVLINHEA